MLGVLPVSMISAAASGGSRSACNVMCLLWTRSHFVFSSSLKPNSSAMSERFGAIRFWSAYSSDAVSVKIVTM